MSNLIAYWKIFWKEMDTYNYLDQPLKALAVRKMRIEKDGWGSAGDIQNQISPGENLWIIGRGNPGIKPDEWCLLLRINVKEYLLDPANYYSNRLVSDDFDFFDPEGQPDLELLLKQISFESRKPIPPDITGKGLGQYFQTRRRITLSDDVLLQDWVREKRLGKI